MSAKARQAKRRANLKKDTEAYQKYLKQDREESCESFDGQKIEKPSRTAGIPAKREVTSKGASR